MNLNTSIELGKLAISAGGPGSGRHPGYTAGYRLGRSHSEQDKKKLSDDELEQHSSKVGTGAEHIRQFKIGYHNGWSAGPAKR